MARLTYLYPLVLLVLLSTSLTWAAEEEEEEVMKEEQVEEVMEEVDMEKAQIGSEVLVMSRSDQMETLNEHNNYRRNVKPTATNMLKMNWNREAEANAQKWAKTCSMKHSHPSQREISTSGCGENLFMSSNKNTWTYAVKSWHDEVKDFKHGVGSINGRIVGHYTQMVWNRSDQLGCAMAYCPNSRYKYFYVCHYCPPGNFNLHTPYKAGPTCRDCPNDCENKLCTNPCPYVDQYSNCPDLVKQHGCNNSNVASWCPASCKCKGQIV